MSGEHGNIPPGQGRLSRAARAGLFPVPAPLIIGVSFLAAYGVLVLLGGHTAVSVRRLVQGGLDHAAVSRDEPAALLSEAIGDGFWIVLPYLLVPFTAALVAALVPAIVFRKGKGRTAVELPPSPRIQPALAIFRGAGLALFCLLMMSILQNNANLVPRLIDGQLGATAQLGTIVEQSLAALGVVATLVGVIELSYVRTRAWRSLHLTLSEANREARAAGGDPEIKAERRRRARSEA
jgi:flagellar biosynthesis protein FlhB